MAIERLSERERQAMHAAGRAAAHTLAYVGRALEPGITTADIDALVREDTARQGGRPSQLGYKGFPSAVCTSRNDVVCHGIPSGSLRLAEGDIVNVDVTTELDGFHGDTSITFMLGRVSEGAERLVKTTQRCLWAGIEAVRPGARLGDVGAAISALARAAGYSVVDSFGGHGIGRRMHMEPHVCHNGRAQTGVRLRAGMAFTIEPMLNQGSAKVRMLEDGWTVVTEDGGWSAQFEHTVLVTEAGYELTTLPPASAQPSAPERPKAQASS